MSIADGLYYLDPKNWNNTRGWVKKKYTNGFKSGGNILDQSASKCYNKLFIIKFPLKWEN